MDQIERANTIRRYLLSTPSKTLEAEGLRVLALECYESASFTEKRSGAEWFESFLAKRNQFNIANAIETTD